MALSSSGPIGFPLPRTAPGLGFDLLALRARCKEDSTACERLVQGLPQGKSRSLHLFPFAHANLADRQRALERKRDQRFAEPVALSSTGPTDVPLPRTAPRPGFDLLALRARRRWESTAPPAWVKQTYAEKVAVCDQNAVCGQRPDRTARISRLGLRSRTTRNRTHHVDGGKPVNDVQVPVVASDRPDERRRANGRHPSVLCQLDITHILVHSREDGLQGAR